MKHYLSIRTLGLLAMLFIALLATTGVHAQARVDDREIIGTWIMTSMKFEGENKELISSKYNQVKVYRANGEYACAEVVQLKDGSYMVYPHEYGKYWLRNGMYSEMGRKAVKWTWISKTAFRGRWKNRIDKWKKVNMPEKLTRHIVDKCKAAQQEPRDIQQLMKKYIFNTQNKLSNHR